MVDPPTSSVQPDFEFDQTAVSRERRVKDLPTFYYHGHFREMLGFVEQHYAHVIDREQRCFFADFRALSHRAQCLYVRLSNRKGRVFSARRLRYPELGDLDPLLAELESGGWISSPGAEHFEDLLAFLTRDVIRDTLARRYAGLARSMKKKELVAFARANCEASDFVDDVRSAGAFVQKRVDTIRYLSFLYFGRVDDSLNRFTMRDLGLVRIQEIRNTFEPRFSERDEAREHYYFACRLQTLKCADDFQLEKLADESAAWPEPVWPAAAADRDKLAYRIGQRLEKTGDRQRAFDVYQLGESTACNERVIRMLFQDNRRDEAQQFLERCLDAPRNDEEWLFAKDLYARKFNRKKTSTLTDTLRAADSVELDESLSGSPERAVAQHLEHAGATVFRTENALWRTLFGVLFWSELFCADSASLHSPFELLPKNLEAGTFAADNAHAIAAKLAALDDKSLSKRRLLKICSEHYGTPNGVFRWRRSVMQAMFAFVDAAPAAALRVILERFCHSFMEVRYGYPDLLVIDDDGARFIEVKTDGDQLRRNQLLRIEQLRAAGFRADILRVRWTLDPQTVYVVVDVETTGGRGERHRVTEIGAVKVQNGKVMDRFASLINPQRTIPPGITRLTGISAEMVADAPYFADIADQFAEFMGDAIFVAHNVDFDYRFISKEFSRLGREFRHARLCTCASMRKLYPGHRSYSLSSLCSLYDIPLRSHHRALCDAEAAAELLLLINEKREELLATGDGGTAQ